MYRKNREERGGNPIRNVAWTWPHYSSPKPLPFNLSCVPPFVVCPSCLPALLYICFLLFPPVESSYLLSSSLYIYKTNTTRREITKINAYENLPPCVKKTFNLTTVYRQIARQPLITLTLTRNIRDIQNGLSHHTPFLTPPYPPTHTPNPYSPVHVLQNLNPVSRLLMNNVF